MTSHVPLPPQLEQFVRDQLAVGRFQSESDVIRAALHLLERYSPPRQTTEPRLKQEQDKGPRDEPSWPAGERLSASDAAGSGKMTRAVGKRSPRGIIADLRSDIGLDDIKDARSVMWSGFPHAGA